MPPGSLWTIPVQQVPGVGPKVADKLQRMGVASVGDLLWTLPLRYEDRRQLCRIAQLPSAGRVMVMGEILAAGEAFTQRKRKRLFEVIISDGSGRLTLTWFHYRKSWMQQQYARGRHLVALGEVRSFGGQRDMSHPDVLFVPAGTTLDDLRARDDARFGRILPVYPLTEGLHQGTAQTLWRKAVSFYISDISHNIPQAIREQFHQPDLATCLQQLHQPDGRTPPAQLESPRNPWRQALAFDEFFFLQLGLLLRRQGVAAEQGYAFTVHHTYTKPLAQLLPYALTGAQKRVLGEIKQDMMAPTPMNRLLQGDVGAGKTLVALMAALVAIENDTQVALVAPTEILAEQHYRTFAQWFEALGLSCTLLTGTMTAKEKAERGAAIAAGEVQAVVGTHAVLQESVTFQRLGLAIIDEQHRFGVRQRAVLRQQQAEGRVPDTLVMTATPIPRTLAMTLYGDLALSVLDELPPGRRPVATRVLRDSQREQMLRALQEACAAGRQAYIVFPLVEESEKSDLKAATEAFDELQRGPLSSCRLGLLHGRLSAADKDAVMRRFKNHEIDVLVATTVIEVGIDVPNATLMVIEHAERFGLAQLHQLRGRVGRGSHESACLLMASDALGDDARARLQIMAATNDGFRIAEEDLALRGPGDFLGTRQAGLPAFHVANLVQDGAILEQARQAAQWALDRQQEIPADEWQAMMVEMERRWQGRLELATTG